MRVINTILIFLLLSACAFPKKDFYHPNQELRDQLGIIQLNTIPPPIQPPIDEPSKGNFEGALIGARNGALFPIGVGAWAGPVGLVLGTLFAPVGAVIGTAVGIDKVHSEKEVNEAVTAVNAVLGQFEYENTLAEVCLQKTNKIAGQFDIRPAKNFNSSVNADTVLNLGYKEFQWHMHGDFDPTLSLKAVIVSTLTDVKNQKVVYSREWVYESPQTNFFELSKNDGQILKEHMQNAINTLCEKITYNLFINNDRWLEPVPVSGQVGINSTILP